MSASLFNYYSDPQDESLSQRLPVSLLLTWIVLKRIALLFNELILFDPLNFVGTLAFL